MRRRSVLKTGAATLTIAGLSLTRFPATMTEAVAAESNAAKRHTIDAKVNATLSRLYETVKGSKELVAKADGVLVLRYGQVWCMSA